MSEKELVSASMRTDPLFTAVREWVWARAYGDNFEVIDAERGLNETFKAITQVPDHLPDTAKVMRPDTQPTPAPTGTLAAPAPEAGAQEPVAISDVSAPMSEIINTPCQGCGKRPIDFVSGAAPQKPLMEQPVESIPVADIERQIDHIKENGIALAKYGGEDLDEGRCRQLCAMYLREFIQAERMGKRLLELYPEKPLMEDIATAVAAERERLLGQFEQAFKSGIKQAEDVYAEAKSNGEYGPACVAEGFKDASQQFLAGIERVRAQDAHDRNVLPEEGKP